MLKMLILFVAVCCAAVLFSSYPLSACGGGGGEECDESWGTYTGITVPTITTPTSSNNGCGINSEVAFSCSQSTDVDYHQLTNCDETYPQDTLTYTWSKSGGSWKNGVSTGRNVTWIAPSTHGNYTVTVTVSDAGAHGGDNDTTHPSAARAMQVIRLDKVRLYLNHFGTAYPYLNDDSFKTRAVVWATCGTQAAYCDLLFDETLDWWFDPGSEGPLDNPDDQEPPYTPFFEDTVDDWPNNWPSLALQWTLIYHVASDPDGNHNRIFSYPRRAAVNLLSQH